VNIFITGGAGFIGSHLAQRFLALKCNVAVIDDLSTGSMRNIVHLKSSPGFSYHIGSVFNEPLVCELVDGCDIVYLLAAAVGVRLIVERAVHTIETNVHGTEIVLRAAAKKKRRVVLASTSEVYGKNSNVPYREDADSVLGPSTVNRWSYACSKALDEFLAMAYWRERETPITVARFFNTVGPRQTGQYGMVVPTFVGQALSSEPITVYGSGEQSRCFGYVGDTVEALVRMANRAAVVGEIINIGNDEEVTINELAKRVKEATHSSSPIVHVPYEQAYGPGFEDMFRRVPALAKLEQLIGFRPQTCLDDIIRSVIEDLREPSSVAARGAAALATRHLEAAVA
jgi:UDP-glucose 4-epimerase